MDGWIWRCVLYGDRCNSWTLIFNSKPQYIEYNTLVLLFKISHISIHVGNPLKSIRNSKIIILVYLGQKERSDRFHIFFHIKPMDARKSISAQFYNLDIVKHIRFIHYYIIHHYILYMGSGVIRLYRFSVLKSIRCLTNWPIHKVKWKF